MKIITGHVWTKLGIKTRSSIEKVKKTNINIFSIEIKSLVKYLIVDPISKTLTLDFHSFFIVIVSLRVLT